MDNDPSITTGPGPSAQDKTARIGIIRLARAAWVILTLLVLALFLLGSPGRFNQLAGQVDYRSLFALNLSAGVYAGYLLGLSYVLVFTHTILALLIYVRRPDEWIALFVAITLVANSALIPLNLMPVLSS